MTTQEQRQALLKAYPKSEAWQERVKKMPEDQVSAIYLRLKRIGKVK